MLNHLSNCCFLVNQYLLVEIILFLHRNFKSGIDIYQWNVRCSLLILHWVNLNLHLQTEYVQQPHINI